jgi:hypothetical protein
MVCVLPLPVCPYAKIVAWYPSKLAATIRFKSTASM